MYLRSMRAEHYRSLRSIRMDLGPVNLFVGANGAGKSNLYRALQLIKAAAAHPDGSTRHEGEDGASDRADAGLGRAV